MIKPIRLTTLNLNGGSIHTNFPSSSGVQSNEFAGANLQVDEMVFSPQGGVLTALQDPPQMYQLINHSSSPVAHSCVI